MVVGVSSRSIDQLSYIDGAVGCLLPNSELLFRVSFISGQAGSWKRSAIAKLDIEH